MHTSTSLVRGSFVLSMAVALLGPPVGEADVAETLGKPGSRLTATAASRDATRDAGDYYTYRGGRIALARSLDVVGVRFAEEVTPQRAGAIVREAEAAASVELAGRAPTRGVSLVRVRNTVEKGAAVPAGDPTGPVLETLRASTEVLYAFPVLVNPATGNRLLPTGEVVARLRTGPLAEELLDARRVERHLLRELARVRDAGQAVVVGLAEELGAAARSEALVSSRPRRAPSAPAGRARCR